MIDHNILPLLCISIIRRNLLAIKIGCGFDANLFKLIGKKFQKKHNIKKRYNFIRRNIFKREY